MSALLLFSSVYHRSCRVILHQQQGEEPEQEEQQQSKEQQEQVRQSAKDVSGVGILFFISSTVSDNTTSTKARTPRAITARRRR